MAIPLSIRAKLKEGLHVHVDKSNCILNETTSVFPRLFFQDEIYPVLRDIFLMQQIFIYAIHLIKSRMDGSDFSRDNGTTCPELPPFHLVNSRPQPLYYNQWLLSWQHHYVMVRKTGWFMPRLCFWEPGRDEGHFVMWVQSRTDPPGRIMSSGRIRRVERFACRILGV